MIAEPGPPEIHVFLLWPKALHRAAEIRADVLQAFQLLDAIRIEWTPERFDENLVRFYGSDLPKGIDKAEEVGIGPFELLVVRDQTPVYAPRRRSWGIGPVNLKTYDAKHRYRGWAGGQYRVHATNDLREADRDLFLVLGRTAEDYRTAPRLGSNQSSRLWRQDVVGAQGWDSLEQLFSALEATLRYVRLHPDSTVGRPLLTVLVDDLRRAELLVGGAESAGTVRTRVGVDVLGFDFRVLGDGSLDRAWQQALLRERIKDGSGIFVPTQEDRVFTELYELLVNRTEFDAQAVSRICGSAEAAALPRGDYGDPVFVRALLDDYLHRMSYAYTLPRSSLIPRNPAILGRRARWRRTIKRRAPRLAVAAWRLKRILRR